MKKGIVVGLLLMISFGFALRWDKPWPKGWPKPVYDYDKKPLDSAKIELGRMLFYDPILSRDSSISCESCHSPYSAFTHVDHALSHGIDDKIGTRNAPAMFNLAWQPRFMWDGIAHTLRQQNQQPIMNPIEMDGDMDLIIQKLKKSSFYPALFSAAFADGKVNEWNMLDALGEFQLTLISANSKYDRVKAKKDQFTTMELKGYALFQQHCNGCHAEPLFSTYGFANNGLPMDPIIADRGRYIITQNPEDSLVFKIPSLRNLKYSFPYMHDGRFKSLYQVMDHFAKGIVD
ncbi:MAG: cytochrome-c peroxidase, partial [Bacteroidota bacterium]|nr:cytochrome-c peroxidase [Bacteroidota bacterium]MDX5430756.1 cytochrome-c peroxidase [Bacteroidota bacterium]MDX5469501.1 cytochrome-c peroxidase [Bacteroidota bacterium]